MERHNKTILIFCFIISIFCTSVSYGVENNNDKNHYDKDSIELLFRESCATTDQIRKLELRELIAKKYPESSFGHFCKGWISQNHLEYPIAEREYIEAIKMKVDLVEAYNNLAAIIMNEKNFDRYNEAESYLLTALRFRDDFYIAFFNLGTLYMELNQFKNAEDSFKKAITYKKDYFQAYNRLGIVYRRNKQPAEAENCFKKALEIYPDSLAARVNLANVNVLNGSYDEGEKFIKQIFSMNNDYRDAHMSYGMLYFLRDNNIHKAKAHYKIATKLDPKYSAAFFNLGYLSFRENLYHEAENYFNLAIENSKNFWKANYWLAELYSTLGESLNDDDLYKDAIEHLNETIIKMNQMGVAQSDEKFSSVYMLRGFLYFKLKDYDLSRQDYKKCLVVNPNVLKAKRNLRRIEKIEKAGNTYSFFNKFLIGLGLLELILAHYFFIFKNKLSEKHFLTLTAVALLFIFIAYIFPQVSKLKIAEAELEKPTTADIMLAYDCQLER